MCSYNRINSTYACQNNYALNTILKGELGFRGQVLSDWNAKTSVSGATNGLDMSMPGDNFGDNNFVWGQNLLNAVNQGTVSTSRLDDMVKRIFAAWYLVGQDQNYPAVSFNSWNNNGGGDVSGDHKTLARTVAGDGIVLLKNVNNALPLNRPASLAIIGRDSINNPSGINSCNDRACNDGTLAMGWGSGTTNFPYLIDPLTAIRAQAQADGTTVVTSTTDNASQGASAAQSAATALGNAGDRNNLDPWNGGNDLVKAVAAVNQKTIVVIHSVGPIILEQFVGLSNVVAVVWAGLPGQESGNGLVDVLYGSKAPSGKLPFTIAKSASDYGTSIVSGDDNFSEGLYIDYRRFDSQGISPRYEFGFGLSYTTFSYTNLAISYTSTTTGPITSTSNAPGGYPALYDPVATITARITNTGSVSGAEVAQLYIGLPSTAPSTPPKQLRGFQKLKLAAGASGTATFVLKRKDLAYWDVSRQLWVVPTGNFVLYIGSSSRDIRLQGTMGPGGSTTTTIGGPGPSSTTTQSTTTSSRTTTLITSTTTSRSTTTSSRTTTRSTTTSSRTTTTTTMATTPPPTGGPMQTKWGQCGGIGFTGPTICSPTASCSTLNPYYAQCL
ncbi:hypothetical protein TWF696_007459 [Orbilia brochopaga]|uniref:beta-glucosidase n=1 Tax=Orbilia brochopaga TaxID=3140254 RepID=A0AAV9UKF8_9PEZI